jgi:hypothetical protein
MIWEFGCLPLYLARLRRNETVTFGYPRERSF